MNYFKITFSAAIFSLIVSSCGGESEAESQSDNTEDESVEQLDFDTENATEIMGDLSVCINIHNQIFPEDLPYTDATNFDDYDPYFPLTGDEILAFSLTNLGIDSSASVNLSYWTEMSSDYMTYVFNVMPNEHELATYIVSYELDYTYVDHLQIAYDDIAEGFQTESSELTKEGINKTIKTYFDEEKIEKISFKLNDSGHFEKL